MRSNGAQRVVLLLATLVSSSAALAGPVADLIVTRNVVLPADVAGTTFNFCLGGFCTGFSPRLYLAPRSDGSYWLGWTGSDGSGRISRIANGAVASTFVYSGEELRGLVAHDDGSFAALLRRTLDFTMRLTKRNASDTPLFSTAITNPNAIAQMVTGDSRLAYGNARYAAYFAVHGVVGTYNGHEGDQLTFFSDLGAPLAGGWSWGCSHQSAGLVGYHPGLNVMGAVCVSDCFPSKGILYNNSRSLRALDGGCDGTTWGQFGQLAAGDGAWKLLFVAQDRPGFPSQGIGLLTFTQSAAVTPILNWLTNTTGSTERDPVFARIGASSPERFLVGWKTTNDNSFRLGVVDTTGAFVLPLEAVTGIAWGNRDDSLRSAPGEKVAWVSATPGTTALKLYEFTYIADRIYANGFQ